jgi:hypothetical protein
MSMLPFARPQTLAPITPFPASGGREPSRFCALVLNQGHTNMPAVSGTLPVESCREQSREPSCKVGI